MITNKITDDETRFPLTFALPQGFHPVDLSAPPDRRADLLYDKLPWLTPEQRVNVVLANQYGVERMIEEGVIYAASFVGRSERDQTAATTAQFTVLLKDAGDRTGRQLATILDAVRQERKNCAAQLIDLAIGRAVAVVEDDRFATPVDILGRPQRNVHNVRQIQLIYPLADRGKLVFFGLATECLRDWDDYVAMMAGIGKTIRWARTEKQSSISAVLDGRL
jgi:hypothetical protein